MAKKLYGDDCPLLFGKWKPKEFIDIWDGADMSAYQDPSPRFDQSYYFDFATVNIVSENVHWPSHFISAHGKMWPGGYTPEALFEPKILEMYFDAKKYMEEKVLKTLAQRIPEFALVDVEKHSVFGRATGFQVGVDCDKLSGVSEDVEERNKIAQEIYESLEDKLKNKFGIIEEEISPHYIIGLVRAGNEKTLTFPNGTLLVTDNPLPDEVNAGTLYMRIISNEHGNKEFHDAVLRFCSDYLNEKYADVLWRGQEGSVISLGLSGDGSLWKINLSNVKCSKKLNGSIFAGYLTEG